jgi:hypothetical protein
MHPYSPHPKSLSLMERGTLRTVVALIDFRKQRFGKLEQAVPDKP